MVYHPRKWMTLLSYGILVSTVMDTIITIYSVTHLQYNGRHYYH